MKKASIALLVSTIFGVGSVSAIASIKVPFFQKISEKQMCGGLPNHCQPTSSLAWNQVSGVDYYGDPSEFLGARYYTVFQREPCITNLRPSDYVRAGTNNFTGTLSDDASVDFQARATANLAQLLRALIGVLPADLQGTLESELRNVVRDRVTSNIALRYQRIDLAPSVLMSSRLTQCLQNTPTNHRVITGISVISVSGTWGRSTVDEVISRVEASVGFRQMSVGARANWNEQKNIALQGSFEPMSYVFAVAFRPGTRQRS